MLPPRYFSCDADIGVLRDIDLHLYGQLCARMPPAHGLRPIPGQISQTESRMIYHLLARIWNGSGNVLELGTLFGDSTQALGLGMAANRKRAGCLFAADAFGAYFPPDEMAVQLEPLLGGRADWPEILNDFGEHRFLRAFEALHAEGQPYSKFLTIRSCLIPVSPAGSATDLRDLIAEAAPLGVVFIDSAKEWYAVRAALIEIVEHLSPGALVAWQDHRWFDSFVIPYFNERFGLHMELLAIGDNMHVYRYRGGLTAEAITAELPETPAALGRDAFRTVFNDIAWRCYLSNDAYGVLSASLQLAFASASLGDEPVAKALFGAARTLPGFGQHSHMLNLAERELSEFLRRG